MFGASSVLTSSGPTPRPDAAACKQMKEVTWKPAKGARKVFICSIGPLRISKNSNNNNRTETETEHKEHSLQYKVMANGLHFIYVNALAIITIVASFKHFLVSLRQWL